LTYTPLTTQTQQTQQVGADRGTKGNTIDLQCQ